MSETMSAWNKQSQPGEEAASDLKGNVLLIEDDVAVRRLLRVAFQDSGLKLSEYGEGRAGLEGIAKSHPDLIILDLGLPDVSGLEIIEAVRGWSRTPIIILSGQGQEQLKVKCFEAGADDYVTKPFGVSELLARVRVAIRRQLQATTNSAEPVFESGGLKVDLAARLVTLNGDPVRLTPLEYKLLVALIRHAGMVVTHGQLLREVWGPEYQDDWQYLRLYVGYLRKKLERPDLGQQFILNEPGIGYRFVTSG
jgi:two-component system KDP operon response regulator KdpE